MSVHLCSCISSSLKDSEFMKYMIHEGELGIWILTCVFATVKLRNPRCVLNL